VSYTKTIIEFLDGTGTVCSFWRGHNPLSELTRENKIRIIQGEYGKENWPTLRQADIAFFQRPFFTKCLHQILYAKDFGLKIWIDLDDWFELPENHPNFDLYNMEFDEKSFRKILMCADVITVTNKTLLDYYSEYFTQVSSRIKILPNALNDYIFKIKPLSNNNIAIWRGQSFHLYDIKDYVRSIKKVMKQFPDWKLNIVGSNIKSFGTLDNHKYLGSFNIHDYFGCIATIKPSVFIVPLEDNKFNRAKSEIVWMESTFCGAVAIMPHWYDDGCKITYNSKEDLEDTMIRIMDNKDLREMFYNNSVKEINDNFLLSKVNEQRLNIINSL
jgi:glycosyltransferase involved in cell wall biosynthesis